jgi:hypothetical protein
MAEIRPIWSPWTGAGLSYFSWYNIPKRGKIYPMVTKSTKWSQNLPNGHKIYQMATKCTKLSQNRPNGHKIDQHWKSLQNLPTLGFSVWQYVIWSSWTGVTQADRDASRPWRRDLLRRVLPPPILSFQALSRTSLKRFSMTSADTTRRSCTWVFVGRFLENGVVA